MKQTTQSKMVPVKIVGSSTFGLYPKISIEKTYNMFITDGFLTNYAGFQSRSIIQELGVGRGFFHSIRGRFAVAVLGNTVYRIDEGLGATFVGNINTSTGFVSMDENLSQQICIVDGQDAWIYYYPDNSLTLQTLSPDFEVGYVQYHNTFFLLASTQNDLNPQRWFAYERATDETITLNTDFALQTKPDCALAVVRLPGRGNNVLVLGKTVGEVWTQVGGAQNYQRNSSFNIDYGVISVSTIATSDEFVVWIGQNEKNSPSLMMTNGSEVKRITTDGIDSLLEDIVQPELSTAFFYRQNGHLFYQFTFFGSQDNLTLVYDVNTNMFFNLSDESYNYHPARQVIFFDKQTLFVSLNDAAIYQMDTSFIGYGYVPNRPDLALVIPRTRFTNTIREPDTDRFRALKFTFLIEQGVNDFYLLSPNQVLCQGLVIAENGDFVITEDGDNIITESGFCPLEETRPRVDLSISTNGNMSFGTKEAYYLNTGGNYRNQIRYWRLGIANELTLQLNFWGMQRFVCGDGVLEVQA